MNSYFASVEQQANPFLRGRPVGVCAYLGENGCIIASSIEAKQRGVKTGMRVREARQRCREIICIENDPLKYRSTTRKIFSILADYTDHIEPYSIDECFLEFSEPSQCHSREGGNLGNDRGSRIKSGMTDVAREMKQRIKKEVGEWLKCSVGIAPTRWLAKFGSDYQKPDGLTVIAREDLPQMYERVKLTDAWGIGNKTEDRLNRLGIFSLNNLRMYPVANLMEVMGVQGYYLWENVNGIEQNANTANVDTNTANNKPKSIGHSYCLPKKTTDSKYLFGVLMKLCEKTGRRLREDGYQAWSLSCAWGYAQGGGDSVQRRVAKPLWSTEDIFATAREFLEKEWSSNNRINFLAISVSDLRPPTHQLSLWDDSNVQQQKNIVKAMDNINTVYGEYTIVRGRLFGMGDYAHDRIGFRKSVEVVRQQRE